MGPTSGSALPTRSSILNGEPSPRSARPYVVVWRERVRDDQRLTSTTKLVAMVLSTYFDAGSCSGYPSKLTLAAGASLSTKFKGSTAVGEAIDRLEGAGHLRVKRERGRRGWTYFASTNGIPYAALADADLLLIPRLYEGLDEKGNPSPGRPKSLAGARAK